MVMQNDREKYEQFFTVFGTQLKFGTYDNFGMNKDELKDLLLFYSSTEKKLVTLKEYVSIQDGAFNEDWVSRSNYYSVVPAIVIKVSHSSAP